MDDYAGYVAAAYGIALVVYGGLITAWRGQLKRALADLERERKGDGHVS